MHDLIDINNNFFLNRYYGEVMRHVKKTILVLGVMVLLSSVYADTAPKVVKAYLGVDTKG